MAHHRRTHGFRVSVAVALAALFMFTGCGGRGDGPPRFDVSGTATFQGQPIPVGSIIFEPDASKGNSGPGGFARITDGKYDTHREAGQGTVGGPHLVRITGTDGKPSDEYAPEGSALFPEYRTTVDLPKERTTHDFDVPQ